MDSIVFPVGTPIDGELTIGTPAALFRPALAIVAHGPDGSSWERGMRAFTEGLLNCVNATRISTQWDLIDCAVRIGLEAAAEGRPDANAAIKLAWAEYERLAAVEVGDPIEGQPVPQKRVPRKLREVKKIVASLFAKDEKPAAKA